MYVLCMLYTVYVCIYCVCIYCVCIYCVCVYCVCMYCVCVYCVCTVQLNANLMTARGLQVENPQVNVDTRAGKDQGVRHGFSPCGREVMAPVCYKLL